MAERGDHLAPLVLWRDASKLGRQEGFVCYFDLCGNAACDAPHLFVDGIAVDDRFMGIQSDAEDDGILFRPEGDEATRSRPFAFMLDLESGNVDVAAEEESTRPSELLLPGFQDAVGRPGILDTLRKLATVLREVRSRPRDFRDADWSWWKPGMPVVWSDVEQEEPEDTFDIGGATVVADELYCATDGCDCTLVEVGFSRREGGGEGEHADDEQLIGHVALEHPRYTVTSMEPEPGRADELKLAWSAYKKRHGDMRERLERRRKHVWDLRFEIADLAGYDIDPPSPARSAKVRPNDPCPCGSGKKHKLCCG